MDRVRFSCPGRVRGQPAFCLEPEAMSLNYLDCTAKPAGEERGAARAGSPCKTRDDVRRASQCNPGGAGPFLPISALLGGSDGATSTPPPPLPWAKNGYAQ